jgi:hypothetical protein
VYIAVVVLGVLFGCKDSPVNSEKPKNHSPAISSLVVFPEVVRPSDSLVVICNANDPDGDALVYDWYTTGVVRIKGAHPNELALYNTYENSRIFYAPDSMHVAAPQDTFWVACGTRDGKGGMDVRLILFIVTRDF